MTREETIKGLECCMIPGAGGCDDCPYVGKGICQELLGEDALALLKTQEAKPVHVTADINHRKVGECPNCGKPINSRDYPNYCGHCGQAVKWDG